MNYTLKYFDLFKLNFKFLIHTFNLKLIEVKIWIFQLQE